MTISANFHGLRIGHLNICSLPNKIADLKVFMDKHIPHILGISETKIKHEETEQENKITNETLLIPGYQLLRRDCSAPLHTGIAIYVHNTIIKYIKRREDLETGPVECVWLEFKKGRGQATLIGNVYRNPASDPSTWIDNFINLMDSVDANNKKVTLLGDFNLDLYKSQVGWYLKWTTAITLFNLKQLITEPTRVSPTSSTLIDHIYTNRKNECMDVEVITFGRSDHKSIFCTLSCKVKRPKKNGHTTVEYRCLKRFIASNYFSDLNNAPFHIVYNEIDVDRAFDLFLGLFYAIVNKHAPLRQKRVKHQSLPPWMTEEIMVAMAQRDFLENNKGRKDPEYKMQRNKVSAVQDKAKGHYFNSLIEKDKNISTLWRAMNEILDKGKRTTWAENTQITPEKFNEHFLSIANTLASQAEARNHDNSSKVLDDLKQFCENHIKPGADFSIPLMTVHDVGTIIEGLDNKKAMGPEKIPVHLLKLALPYIVEPLTYIYNLSIKQNVFPSSLKVAKVVPLPKSKDKSDPNNFRPISLLPILTKPIEKHIQKHLLNFMETNTLFHKFQSGFRKNHSCHTSLTTLIDTWLSAINNEKLTGAVFLDFRKAFDLVDHSILLKKLHIYLRNSNTISFFGSYLEDRKQFVSLNCKTSDIGSLTHGVPQGSILGPILFCIYINDLPLCIENDCVRCDLFADDSSIHAQGKSTENVELSLQTSLNKIDEWCVANHMIIHAGKTKSMIITTRQKHQLKTLSLNLSVGSTPIEQVREHRVLGAILDQEMKWESHISSLCKRVSRNLYLLSKLSSYASRDALLIFYNAHIMSHINYASSIWDGAGELHLKKLDSLHRRAAKIIGRGLQISTEDKQKYLKMLPLKKQLFYNKAVTMYKVWHGEIPNYIASTFRKATTRYHSSNFILPFTRIDLFKRSLVFSGASTWNALPPSVRDCKSLKSFKNNLFQHLVI